jgi:hypothetical protein
MKKIFVVVLIILSNSLYSQIIQYLDIVPTFGYHFGGRARFYEGDFKIEDNATYGITLSAPVEWGVRGEFSWSRSDSKGRFIPYIAGYEPDELEMASNYFLLGAMKELGEADINLKAFGGFHLGLAWFDSKDSRYYDEFRFSVGLAGGLEYMFTDHIGIRAQGRFLIPISFSGVGMYCGIGTGGSSCGISGGGWGTILQGDFSGGLVIRLGKGY